jgi:hypothetical protein
MKERDCFVVEAALQCGFDYVDDEATVLQVDEGALVAFVRRVEAHTRPVPPDARPLIDHHAAMEAFAMDAAVIVRRAHVRLNRVGKRARRKINRAVPDQYGVGPGVLALNRVHSLNLAGIVALLSQTNEIMDDIEWMDGPGRLNRIVIDPKPSRFWRNQHA